MYTPNYTGKDESTRQEFEALSLQLNVSTFTQAGIGEIYRPRSPAEIQASVPITNYYQEYGDLRRYGAATGPSFPDCTLAWQHAVAQATVTPASGLKGAPVYIPGSQYGWRVTAPAIAPNGAPFMIYGDNSYYSFIWTNQDINILEIRNVQQNAGVVLRDFQIIGVHPAPTKPGLHIKNSSYGVGINLHIQGFQRGLFFEPTAVPPGSCYSWTLIGCVIISNSLINIDCEDQTNFLCMYNCTFGASATGLRFFDSGGLEIFGGDCEGCTANNIDIDGSSEIRLAGTIQGVDFEASAAAQGIIRLGNTSLIRDLSIISCGFYNSGAAAYHINPQRIDGVTVMNCTGNTGTSSGQLINLSGPVLRNLVLINSPALGYEGVTVIGGAQHPVKVQSGGNYTLGLADNGKDIRMTHASVLTIPATASVPIAVGFECEVHQWSAGGGLTVSPAGGVTLYWVGTDFTTGPRVLQNFARARLKKLDTNIWSIEGFGIA